MIDLLGELRRKWPDAPAPLLELVAARVLLRIALRCFHGASHDYDDAVRDFFRAPSSLNKLERLELAAAAETARARLAAWGDLLIEHRVQVQWSVDDHGLQKSRRYGEAIGGAAFVVAIKRAAYAAWKARHARRAEQRGQTFVPYVLPEARGDAFITEDPTNYCTLRVTDIGDQSPFMRNARKTLKVWSRWYAMHI